MRKNPPGMAMARTQLRTAAIAVAAALLVLGGGPTPQAAAQPGTPPRPASASTSHGVLLVAVGDIACPPGQPRAARRCHHAATARVAQRLRPAAVALLGDTQY